MTYYDNGGDWIIYTLGILIVIISIIGAIFA